MTDFHTVPLQNAHLSAIAELEKICFAEPWSERALTMLTQSGNFGIAALTHEGRLIGYGGMLTVLDEGQITNIAVHPAFRRMGVGKAVLSAIVSQAEQQGITEVSLEVRVSNLAAKELYLQMGFEIAGVRKRFYSHPTEDGLVMVKEIRKRL